MLNITQLQTLKNAILAETNPTIVAARNAGATGAIADWYNLPSLVKVWRTNVPVIDIEDAITWSNYTPNDEPDGTTLYTNRMLNAQSKQFNLQNMKLGKEHINASKANVRVGLKDAVTGLYTGAAGAVVSAGGAGGVTVLNACTRFATNCESLFATVGATTSPVTAKLLTYEGNISNEDVVLAINS